MPHPRPALLPLSLSQVDPNHLVTTGEEGFFGCCKNAANPGQPYSERPALRCRAGGRAGRAGAWGAAQRGRCSGLLWPCRTGHTQVGAAARHTRYAPGLPPFLPECSRVGRGGGAGLYPGPLVPRHRLCRNPRLGEPSWQPSAGCAVLAVRAERRSARLPCACAQAGEHRFTACCSCAALPVHLPAHGCHALSARPPPRLPTC